MIYSTKKLGEVCEIVTGGTPKTENFEFYGGDILWAGPSDLDQGMYAIDTSKKITCKAVEAGGARLIPAGGVMFSCIGNIGKIAIAQEDMATNQQINTFVPNKGTLDSKYLYYTLVFKTPEFLAKTSQTTLPIINKSRCAEIEIPVPPMGEQRKIVAKIEKQFAKIDEAARLRAESEALADQLFPAALHEIFSAAESRGWQMVAVGDLCDIKGGKRLPKGHAFVAGPTKHPYIRVADFISHGIDQNNLKYISDGTFKSISRYTVSKADVFISIAGTIGSTGIIPENLDGANLTENAAKLTNLKGIDQHYLMYMLTSVDAKRQMTGDMIQTTIAKLGLFRIARLKIPLPPLAEQKKIVKKFDALSEKVRSLQALQSAQAADLKALKQSILHKAFTQ